MYNGVETHSTLQLVAKPPVLKRAAVMAIVVGCVIAVVNHGDKIASNEMTAPDWIRVGITFLVPYTVSTLSSVLALREQERMIISMQRERDGKGLV